MSNSLQLHSDLLHGGIPVIDKADLRVPQKVWFTREFQQVYESSLRAQRSPWRPGKYFVSTADMREYGYDVRLHLSSTLTAKPIHKLEIYDTGEKTYEEMRTLAGRVFDCEPERLGLMRVDLCADIQGVDVGWFKRHTLIKSKQTHREFGTVLPYQTIRKGKAETLYAGVKPNQYRIYNKTLERLVRWRWYARQLARDFPDCPPISYLEMYGHSVEQVMTRVERQIAGRDLQSLELSDFRSLQRAPFLSPFEKVVFYEAHRGEPSLEQYGFLRWTSGMFLREMVMKDGLPATRGFMKEKLGRNLYREWNMYEPFLHCESEGPCIDASGLRSSYKRSVIAQIGIPGRGLLR